VAGHILATNSSSNRLDIDQLSLIENNCFLQLKTATCDSNVFVLLIPNTHEFSQHLRRSRLFLSKAIWLVKARHCTSCRRETTPLNFHYCKTRNCLPFISWPPQIYENNGSRIFDK